MRAFNSNPCQTKDYLRQERRSNGFSNDLPTGTRNLFRQYKDRGALGNIGSKKDATHEQPTKEKSAPSQEPKIIKEATPESHEATPESHEATPESRFFLDRLPTFGDGLNNIERFWRNKRSGYYDD